VLKIPTEVIESQKKKKKKEKEGRPPPYFLQTVWGKKGAAASFTGQVQKLRIKEKKRQNCYS